MASRQRPQAFACCAEQADHPRAPFGPAPLLSVADVAFRSGQRRFEIRDRLVELADQRAKLKSLVEDLPVEVCFIESGQPLTSDQFAGARTLRGENVPG